MQRGGRACGLVGALAAWPRPLEEKSFYLDEVKSRQSSVLTELIRRLGGKVESFLNKDVNVVITGNKEADGSSEVKGDAVASPRPQKESTNDPSRRPGTPRPQVCGSRGKALLEKAIRNNEKSRSSVLANARSWGVKIVGVEQFLRFVDRLTVERSAHKSKRSEKMPSDASGQRVVKAGVLKGGYIKVEDCSRRYRPLHTQSMTFPMLSYTGRFSPFEPPAPPRPCRRKEEEFSKDQLMKSEEPISSHDKPSAPLQRTPSPRRQRKKGSGYCECCQICYSDRDEHLVSDVHRHFVQDVSNYAVVDQLVDGMNGGFSSYPDPHIDPVLTRLACDSPGPLSPSEEMKQHSNSKSESDFQAVFINFPDPSAENIITNTVGANPDFEIVSNLLPQPSIDVPPQTTSEAKCENEKENNNELLHPESKSQIPKDCLKESSCVVPDSKPLLEVPHLPTEGFVCLVASAPKEIAEVDCLKPTSSPLPQQQPTVDGGDIFIACSKSPNQQFIDCNGEKDTVLEKEHSLPAVEPLEPAPFPSVVKLSKWDYSSKRSSSFDVPLASASSPLWFKSRSIEVNPRKRCRSFTLSYVKPPKKRRTILWSGQVPDLSKEDSADSGPHPLVDNPAKPDQHASDSGNCILETLNCVISQCNPLEMQTSAFAKDCQTFQNNQQTHCGAQNQEVTELIPNRECELESCAVALSQTGTQSELSPPELYPFYYDDHMQQFSFTDPPTLAPAVPLPSPSKKTARLASSQASSASLLSQSFSSVCIESALIPDFTFSPTSSESDWDSGLLSHLGPAVQLQPKAGNCQLDLGLLLQRSCTGLQDGSYTSRLCSVLQPAIPSSAGFGDKMNPNSLYRPIETIDRWIVQSLGV